MLTITFEHISQTKYKKMKHMNIKGNPAIPYLNPSTLKLLPVFTKQKKIIY